MKYKVICLCTVLAVFLCAFAVQSYEAPTNRYHQHLEAREKAPCTGHGENVFCTHLPLINITTDEPVPEPHLYDENGEKIRDNAGTAVQNNAVVGATMAVIDDARSNNHLTDTPTLKERGLIRVRGNSSRSFDKKGYLFKCKKDDLVENKDIELLGMTADSDWVFHGPFLDKTLIRNYLCYNLAGEIMDYAPNVRFFELFLNDEYMGVYLAVEKIGYSEEGRVNITETDPKQAQTSFILKVDRIQENDFYNLNTFFDNNGQRGLDYRKSEKLSIDYPSSTLTQEQKEYIRYEISKFEKALSSFDSGNKESGYHKYIDVDSFVRYFLLNEFTANSDAGRLSTYYAKDIRGKMYMIPWDFNNAFGNYFTDILEIQSIYSANQWFGFLLRDPYFTQEVIDTYWELRKTFFSEDYLYTYIDETIDYLGDAIDRNYEKWGYSFTEEFIQSNRYMLRPKERNPRSYEEAVEDLKTVIAERTAYLDRTIESLKARCHDSVNKQFRIEEEN